MGPVSELYLGFPNATAALPTRHEGGVRGVLVREYGSHVEIEFIEIANFLDQISDKSLDILDGFLTMIEILPTRGELIYHCLNKPWIKENWQFLVSGWGITRRKIRKARAELEDARHIRWARKLNIGKEFKAQ